ncbi:hypothetical protein CY35_12G048400 [Sphagnum magellanicum]|nr:hypothetical protein CY35_12G048400 [Sphagnum magellanicum]
MGHAEPETLGDSNIMAIMGSFAFCCFFMPCVGASLEQALKNYYPATNLQSPHLQSCGSLRKKIKVNHQTDFILVCMCGKGAKISKVLRNKKGAGGLKTCGSQNTKRKREIRVKLTLLRWRWRCREDQTHRKIGIPYPFCEKSICE